MGTNRLLFFSPLLIPVVAWLVYEFIVSRLPYG